MYIKTLLLFNIVCTASVLGADCEDDSDSEEFTSCPGYRTVKAGKKVTLDCEFDNRITKESCKWTRPSKSQPNVFEDSNPRDGYDFVGDFCSLEIRSVKSSDNGLWTCEPNGGSVTVDGGLTVAEDVTNLELNITDPDGNLIPKDQDGHYNIKYKYRNEKIKIACSSIGRPRAKMTIEFRDPATANTVLSDDDNTVTHSGCKKYPDCSNGYNEKKYNVSKLSSYDHVQTYIQCVDTKIRCTFEVDKFNSTYKEVSVKFGKLCDKDVCKEPMCSAHGSCGNEPQVCSCDSGWDGHFCQQEDTGMSAGEKAGLGIGITAFIIALLAAIGFVVKKYFPKYFPKVGVSEPVDSEELDKFNTVPL